MWWGDCAVWLCKFRNVYRNLSKHRSASWFGAVALFPLMETTNESWRCKTCKQVGRTNASVQTKQSIKIIKHRSASKKHPGSTNSQSMASFVCGCDSGCCTFPRTPNNGCRIRQNPQRLPVTGRPLQHKTKVNWWENDSDWRSTHRRKSCLAAGRGWSAPAMKPLKKDCPGQQELISLLVINYHYNFHINHIGSNYMLNSLDSSSGLLVWWLQLWVLVTSKYATSIGLEPIQYEKASTHLHFALLKLLISHTEA